MLTTRFTAAKTLAAAVLLSLTTILLSLLNRRSSQLKQISEQYSESLMQHFGSISVSRVSLFVTLFSAIGLYCELMIIRWHATAFHLFAVFKNISLLACFLGLGIGYAISNRKPILLPSVLPMISAQFLFMELLRNSRFQYLVQSPVAERTGQSLLYLSWRHSLVPYGVILLTFTLTAMAFIPLGQITSYFMSKLPRLQAYGWNLFGSLLGISAFTLLSYFWTPPALWLLFPTLALLWFVRHHRRTFWLSGVLALVAIIVVQWPRQGETEFHSPYQLISFYRERLTLTVNNSWYQNMFQQDIDQNTPYMLPYQFVKNPKRVLVVGAGTGNDVSAALLNGASHVDAVEIDPAILMLGKQFHPDRPYSDPNVTAILDDARSYIRRSDQNYDLIVYGSLDAHTSYSALSSARLDSFVYTIEAFREARKLLTDDGLISLTFFKTSPEHGKKLFMMLDEAFDGKEPRVFKDLTFVIGGGNKYLSTRVGKPFVDVTSKYTSATLQATPSTDDWPFLYINKRTYPISYVILLSVLFIVALVIANQVVDKPARLVSAPSFFLGVGFLLVETKNITELGLVLGNRWQVISVVIASILLMAFFANVIAMRFKTLNLGLIYVLLLSSLALGTISLPAIAASGNWKNSLPLATALLAAPLFFSGLAFSLELKRASSILIVMSSNLLGAMLGGILEYNSLYFGFRGLYVIAMFVYAVAFFFSIRRWKPIVF